MSRDGWATLPCGATGLSAVCDCGISRSYSLTIFKARDSNATSLSTYDFSTLYTTLPHNLIILNLLILLKEPSREKALPTLHVMTEMHFLLQKRTKKYHA